MFTRGSNNITTLKRLKDLMDGRVIVAVRKIQRERGRNIREERRS